MLLIPLTLLISEILGDPIFLKRPKNCSSELSPDFPRKLYKWTPKNPINLWELSGRYQGDIVAKPSQDSPSRNERCVMRRGVDYWPDGVVPIEIYYDEFTVDELKVISEALSIIEENTCIRFPQRLPNETSYIELKGSLGYGECWSYIGKIEGNQTVSLGDGCVHTHHVLHEVLHSLGMVHQHSSPDRDDYITIHWENIDPEFTEWFDKYDWYEYTDFGLGYDYYSVMHYSAYVASKNGEPTISSKDPNVKIRERKTLSSKDIQKLNIMYCSGRNGWNYIRSFGGYVFDVVGGISPTAKYSFMLSATLILLVLVILMGKLLFQGVLQLCSFPHTMESNPLDRKQTPVVAEKNKNITQHH